MSIQQIKDYIFAIYPELKSISRVKQSVSPAVIFSPKVVKILRPALLVSILFIVLSAGIYLGLYLSGLYSPPAPPLPGLDNPEITPTNSPQSSLSPLRQSLINFNLNLPDPFLPPLDDYIYLDEPDSE